MILSQSVCSTPDQLLALLRGQLSTREECDLQTHLDACESCRLRLENTAAGADAWKEAQEFLGSTPDQEFVEDTCVGQANRVSLQIQNALDSLGPTDDPESLGRIGGYEVSGVVGSGGMGIVLKAHDRSLDRIVAIKVMAAHLASSGSARKRFAREAKAAAAVLHPNVIAIHSVASDDACPYLVMPFVRGASLQRRIDSQGQLPLKDTLRIGSQIAAGLAAAHEQGLVHRDIKPANILLEEGVERVTITDFGLARAVDDASMTCSGVIAGTPQYMSPEQTRGEAIDARSDLFSLGSVLYAMCAGRPPFRAETTYGVLHRIANDDPTPLCDVNSDVPVWLSCIIERLMAKRADDRFESAALVAELLEDCLAHVQQPATTPLPESVEQLSQLLPAESAAANSPQKQLRQLFDKRLGQLFDKQLGQLFDTRPPIGKLIAAAAFAFLLILAGVLIVLELNKGTLTIESEAKDVPVRIMQGDNLVKQLTVTKSPQNVRIAAGNYVIVVDGRFDVTVVDGGNISLQRGGTDVVKIVLLDKPLKHNESAEAIKLNKPPQDEALHFVGFGEYWQHLTGMRVGGNDAEFIQNNSNLRGGLWIGEVDAGSPAALAGLTSRDALVGLGPWEILSESDLRFVDRQLRTGKLKSTNLKVHIFRPGEGLLFGHVTLDAKKIADIGKLVLSSKFRPGDLNDLRFGKRDELGPYATPSRVGEAFTPQDTIDDFSNFPALGNGIEEVGMIVGVVPPQSGSEPPSAELYLVQADGVRAIENNPTRFAQNIQPAPFQPVPGKEPFRVGYHALTFATEKTPSVTLEMMAGSAHVYVADVVGLANEQGRKSLNIPQEGNNCEPWLPVSFPLHQQSKWATRFMNLDGWEKKSDWIYTHVVAHEFNLKPDGTRTVRIEPADDSRASTLQYEGDFPSVSGFAFRGADAQRAPEVADTSNHPHGSSSLRTFDYHGQCVRAEDGLPVTGAVARLFIRGQKRSSMRLFELTTTDTGGRFRFDTPTDPEIDLARCQIAVTATGRASRVFFWQELPELTRIEMQPSASLKGRVTDLESRPVAGARVRLGPNRMPGVHDAVTDQDGRYEIGDLVKADKLDLGAGISNVLHVEHPDGGKTTKRVDSIPSTVDVTVEISSLAGNESESRTVVDTLRRRWKLLDEAYKQGQVSLREVLAAARDLAEAEVAASASSDERRQAGQRLVDVLTQLKTTVEALYKNAEAGEADVLAVEAHLQTAQAELQKTEADLRRTQADESLVPSKRRDPRCSFLEAEGQVADLPRHP